MLKQIENDKVLVLLNIIRGSSGGPETHSGIGMVYAAIFEAKHKNTFRNPLAAVTRELPSEKLYSPKLMIEVQYRLKIIFLGVYTFFSYDSACVHSNMHAKVIEKVSTVLI